MRYNYPVVQDANEEWHPPKWAHDPERDYVVEFSAIAYITVRVKANSTARARVLATYHLKGKDPSGAQVTGKNVTLCGACAAKGIVISGESLQIDYCEEVITDESALADPSDSVG